MIILVYIAEASGLNYPNHKVIATASLGRNVLETKVSSPRNTTRFDSSLAWKTDVDSIKRMKSDNIPIKVECFCMGKMGREMIGFVVVPLRTVNILTGNKVMTITPKWHRLIGLKHSWKTLKPEILMFVTITDVVGVQIINEMRNTTSTATRNMLTPQQGIHIELNRKDQHIQIGNDSSDCHRFTVEIHWYHCEWLSYLTENPSDKDSFQMRYTLLDCPTEERNLPKMYGACDEERYMVHEKITIHLRSSLQMIRNYFENVFYIPMYIYCNEEIIGRVFFKISTALPDTNDLKDFRLLTKDDTFVSINESFIYPTKSTSSFIDENHRPTLKYNLTLKYHDPSRETSENQHQPQESESHKCFESNHQSDEQLKTNSYDDNDESNHATGRETVEQSIKRRNVLIQKLLTSQIDPPVSAKKTESIRFVDVTTPPSPQAQTRSRTHQRCEESTSPNRIRNDVFTSPVDKFCRSPKSVSFNPQSEDDISAWKNKQQEAFLAGLKSKENEHLNSLAEEWLRRQNREEEKFAAKMKKCKLLTEALENALSAIKEKDTISMDHKKLDDAAQLQRKKHDEEKISALTDQMRRTAIDHDYQLKLMEIKLKEMEMKRKFSDDENDKLKTTLKRLEEENESLRCRNIELDSISSRKLQSIELKLKHSQELELFYKNKWRLAEDKLNEIQTTKEVKFPQNNRHFRTCVTAPSLSCHESDFYCENKNISSNPKSVDEKIESFEDSEDDFNQKYKKSGLNAALNIFVFYVLPHLIIVGYFSYVTYHYVEKTRKTCIDDCVLRLCSPYGMLLLVVGLVYVGLLYFKIIKRYFGTVLYNSILQPVGQFFKRLFKGIVPKVILVALLLAILVGYSVFETKEDFARLRALGGIVVFITIGFSISANRRLIVWRPVICGFTFQFLLGVLFIRWPVGREIFECFGDKVAQFLAFGIDGAAFVFGDFLVHEKGVFAFAVLPIIFFFSLCVSVSYYLGAMQWLLFRLGWVLQSVLGTTICESVNAAGNIFLGQTESPLVIKPYINVLTHSELHAVMVSGFSTVSGSVMAAYISFGAQPQHLITATVMAAPASLFFAKLVYPEHEETFTSTSNIQMEKSPDSSILDAASNGASQAISLILNIIANLVAFVAVVAFADALLQWITVLLGFEDVGIQFLLGKVFMPVSWLIGVDWEDCEEVGNIIGTKTIVNEFVAFRLLGQYVEDDKISKRSAAIATFAICSFANPSSIGIMVGGLSALAPERRPAITKIVLRALASGCFVTLITASVASILMPDTL